MQIYEVRDWRKIPREMTNTHQKSIRVHRNHPRRHTAHGHTGRGSSEEFNVCAICTVLPCIQNAITERFRESTEHFASVKNGCRRASRRTPSRLVLVPGISTSVSPPLISVEELYEELSERTPLPTPSPELHAKSMTNCAHDPVVPNTQPMTILLTVMRVP